ncbi:hypothetical protein FEM03_23995 [Phragmitibacter flavus]|uniref:Fibronectin type-III domain-containing protein n=1 Tax=Phragmitibacter flavus TaxID=2576071 RepID=A0A5R8K9J5_9BACT|nr:ELWxxDGT repeat protein [Phragmitibacter flavus]TLD68179.1 hypothetical protein FEM03_23995 [Phragmitibacter flavus]
MGKKLLMIPSFALTLNRRLAGTFLLSALVFGLWLPHARALDPYLVKDINTARLDTHGNPENFVRVGSTIYFTATTLDTGRELWKTDGTEAGTVMVKDISPGQNDSQLANFLAVGSTLYFTIGHGPGVDALWKSDGTEAGTVFIKQISNSENEPYPVTLAAIGNTLYFSPFVSGTGKELWKTDGTHQGTVPVKDIWPGHNSSFIANMTVVGSTLYFAAVSDLATAKELWKSDGTSAGTVMVKDILPGKDLSSDPQNFVSMGGKLYFSASGGMDGGGRELWKSDGTAAGTVMVKDIFANSSSSNPQNLAVMGDSLFFVVGSGPYQLWKSDGTEAGTNSVFAGFSGNIPPSNLTAVNDTLYFQAAAGGIERLWRTNGSAQTTEILGSTVTPVGGIPFSPSNLTAAGSMLYFVAQTNDYGRELWITDGTDPGTAMVKDLRADDDSSNPDYLVEMGGFVYFRADDGNFGPELWRSEGSAEGTTMVKDIDVRGADAGFTDVMIFGGSAFFKAVTEEHGSELWKTDGTAAGTVLVEDITEGPEGSFPEPLKVVGSALYLSAYDDAHGYELWKTDGTENGAVLVKDVRPGPFSSDIKAGPVVGNTFYFSASSEDHGHELWKTDGTAAGTVMVKDIYPGVANSFSFVYGPGVVLDNTLYFIANDGINGEELWKSDGTADGTVMVKDILPGSGSSSPNYLTLVGDRFYFIASNGTDGRALWKSDGTVAGTVLVKDSDGNVLKPLYFRVMGNTVYCTIAVSGNATELWKTDGTAAGTNLVKTITPRSTHFDQLTVTGNSLYFFIKNNQGFTLWKSDGTTAGTVMVTNLPMQSSPPSRVIGVGNTLYFHFDDTIHGEELWKSDGTAAGTRLVHDINPGFAGSFAYGDTILDHRLIFNAETAEYGRELWAYAIPPEVHTEPSSTLGDTIATLHGTVNANGYATTALFEYGTTTSYGSMAAVVLAPNNGISTLNVSVGLSNLVPNTTYQYRLIAQNIGNSAQGSNETFTTLPDPNTPYGGTMTLAPASPVDAGAPLTVTFANWTDDNYPSLSYAVSIDGNWVSPQGASAIRNPIPAPTTPGLYTLSGRIFDGTSSYTEVSTTFTVNTPLQTWRKTHFGITTNSGNAADTADFDNDGIANLLEWATLLNPAAASVLPVSATLNAATNNMEFIYTRNKAALDAGAIFIVEWSETLAAGSWSSMGVDEEILSNNGTAQQVKATIPAGVLGYRFLRLRVTPPP